MKRVFCSIFAALLSAAVVQADADDPPSRAARLSFISGTVSFQPGSVEDWVPASLNRPMTTGDRLWTEPDARAEMHLGSAAIRLNGRTSFAFLNLDDRMAQIQVSSGTVIVRLRRLADDESFEIDTPQVALTLLRPGEYRVEVNEQGDTTLAGVRGGEAEANVPNQAFTIHARDQIRVTGVDPPVFDTRAIPPADAFDAWSQERDRREDMSQSAQHVSRDIPGYADLDGNGVWREYPDYGWVWTPRVVVAGWAPYRDGHWAWIAPWGWTWVDDAPWGYAPFHYGRWVFVGGGWAWVPGPIVPRPVYAPAMVAWVGGAGWSVGVSIGGPAVGWFPLGPREVWVPAYHYSPTYIERVNVTNTVIVNRTVINNINVTNVNYVNRNVVGAVTVVPQGALTSGRPVAAAAVRVPPETVARAQVSQVSAVAPERAAVLGGRAQTSAAPPSAVMGRTVVAKQAPPAPAPSFAQQQQVLRQNPGQPVPRSSFPQVQQSPGSQSASPRPAVRQLTPPGTTPAPAVRTPSQPVPAQTNSPSEIRRQTVQPASPPAQQQQQPQLRGAPAPVQPSESAPVTRQPQQPASPPAQQQPQPQLRRAPAPVQPPESAPVTRQPQPASPSAPAQTAPPVRTAPGSPAAASREAPRRENKQENKQKGRAEKDGKRTD